MTDPRTGDLTKPGAHQSTQLSRGDSGHFYEDLTMGERARLAVGIVALATSLFGVSLIALELIF